MGVEEEGERAGGREEEGGRAGEREEEVGRKGSRKAGWKRVTRGERRIQQHIRG